MMDYNTVRKGRNGSYIYSYAHKMATTAYPGEANAFLDAVSRSFSELKRNCEE